MSESCPPVTPTTCIRRWRARWWRVVVPIEEYQQLRQAMEEQQVNEEFDAARASTWPAARPGRSATVSHEEAGRRLGMPSR